MSALLFDGIRRLENDNGELVFYQRLEERLASLKEGVNNAIDVLRSVNQLFASTPHVSRMQFHLFSAPLVQRYPYIQSVSYSRFISHAERPAFERTLRSLVPDGSVTEMRGDRPVPAGVRERYLVIDYIEPVAGNEAALGLDTAYPPFNRAAYQRAYDSGLPAAGKPVRRTQDVRPGIVVMMPVYRYGAALPDVAARRAAMVGETGMVILPGELVRRILVAHMVADPHGVDLRVYAGTAPDPGALVYHLRREPAEWMPRLPRWLYPAPAPRYAKTFDVAGTPWLLSASRADEVLLSDHLASLFALALGILVSLLAAAYVYTLTWRQRHIEHRVEQGTALLREANQSLLLRERAIEASPNAIVMTAAGRDMPVVYVNPAFERTTGYSSGEMLGRSLSVLLGADLEQQGLEELRAAIREQRDGHAVLRNYCKNGTLFWNDVTMSPVRDENGVVTHYVSVQHDVTALRAYEAELARHATHDTLTGLPNRLLLQDRLRQNLAHAAREGYALWVLSIDLDRFKFLNSRLGHEGGDRLLQALARRLESAVGALDTVARIGSDEFAILMLPVQASDMPRVDGLGRIMDSVSEPIMIDANEVFLSCSIGVAVYPDDGAEPDLLLERADIAMYRAKEMGRGNYQFYTAAMNEQFDERLLIEGALRTALERGEFVLHYQPQVDLPSGRIVGMEALIRWQHPDLGMIAPARFIALAEETGLIIPIGAWVLRSACEQLQAWQGEGRGRLRMAVNISVRQVAEHDFVQSVAQVLADTGLEPDCLELELTESQVMNDVEHSIEIMQALKKLGVKLAIDDFGTGYSSLAHLKRFEVDVLKIDQTFVRDLAVDPDDAAIVVTIIALAANLNLEVISEGVETLEQLSFLRQNGCHQVQGYYLSRPVSAAAFERVLKDNEESVEAASGRALSSRADLPQA